MDIIVCGNLYVLFLPSIWLRFLYMRNSEIGFSLTDIRKLEYLPIYLDIRESMLIMFVYKWQNKILMSPSDQEDRRCECCDILGACERGKNLILN